MRHKVDDLLNLCSHERAKFVRLDPYEKTIVYRSVFGRNAQRCMGRRTIWPYDADALRSK